MRPYYEDGLVKIYHGDCREVLPTLAPVETCITDPPYGLAFMGKAWDHAVPDETYWRLVRGAVLPGGMLLAFGGTRLWHWLAVGIESAGWEIRDTLMWLYGSGFPKGHDISKAIDKAAGAEREVLGGNPNGGRHGSSKYGQVVTDGADVITTAPATEAAKLWDGWNVALKPSWEPVILAMNPLDGTFAQNALKHGVAGLNVDGSRIGTDVGDYDHVGDSSDAKRHDGRESWRLTQRKQPPHTSGRWPANLALDEEAAALLDEQSGERPGMVRPTLRRGSTTGEGAGFKGGSGVQDGVEVGYGDSGGASRFFYTSKASRADRGEGNGHPTVKPSDLMKWLVTLTATPTGGTVLDPFMGSGTTLYAAKEMGRKAIGIELEEAHCEIAAQRCSQEVLAL